MKQTWMLKKCFTFLIFSCILTTSMYGQSWEPLAKVVPANRLLNDNFGRAVSISGNFAIVGAYREDEDSNEGDSKADAGSAYIFRFDGTNWVFQQKITASDRTGGDNFGWSVSISGNLAFVGAYNHDDLVQGLSNSGAAYVFAYNGTSWVEQQKLLHSDRATNDNFGYSVAIKGNYAVVGAQNEDEDENLSNTVLGAGSAYIFHYNGTNWVQMQKIVGINRFSNSFFGTSVAISDSVLAVGTYNCWDPAGENQVINAGATYIFKLTESTWNMQQKIVPPVRARDDNFGCSVSLSGDYLLVGAYREDEDSLDTQTMTNAGSAYVFKQSGNTWLQQQKLTAPDRSADDNFGYSVSISNNHALVGAFNEDEDTLGNQTLSAAGSAYLFALEDTVWTFKQKLIASDRNATDNLGYSVSISNNALILGAWKNDYDANNENLTEQAGSAYIFGLPEVKDPIEHHLFVGDTTIQAEVSACFNAYDTISIAGTDNVVVFDSASVVNLIAGKCIRMLPGFHAILGSEVHASITLDSSFCEPETKSLLLVGNPNHEVASLTRANEFRVDQKNKGLKISPNPNTGRFELELSGFEGPARVVVTNASGRVVARLEMKNQNRHTFDFSAMDKGLYLVTVLSGNERRSGKVLVR